MSASTGRATVPEDAIFIPSTGGDDALAERVLAWLNAPSAREKATLLKQYPELFSPAADDVLSFLSEQYADRPIELDTMREHRQLLDLIRAQGGSKDAIERAYVDADGGLLALPLPEWLDDAANQLYAVMHAGPRSQTAAERVALLRGMLARIAQAGQVRLEVRADLQTRLWDALDDLIVASPRDKQEEGIACLEGALAVYSLDRYPQQYAQTQLCLGNAYQERVAGDRRANLERAIACYREALRVYSPTRFASGYALAQNNLGNTYHLRIAGSKRDNLEEALACYTRALGVFSKNEDPDTFAMVQNNRGNTYLKRIAGVRGDNLEAAMACYRDALEVYTPDDYPADYAMLHVGLGTAYRSRVAGSERQNLEEALAHYGAALRIYTPEHFPLNYAQVQLNLGGAYDERIAGNWRDNLEHAITAYTEALRFYTADAAPEQYALTHYALGNAYRARIAGDRTKNLERSLACYRTALEIYSADTFPIECRNAHLGIARTALDGLVPEARSRGDGEGEFAAYRLAHEAYTAARPIQAELGWLEASPQGRATLRAAQPGVREMYVRDAWCLWQLGDLTSAVVALEAGRAQALAESEALAGELPLELCPEHAQAVAEAHAALLEARAREDRAELRQARDALVTVRSAVRSHCAPGYLPGEPRFSEVIAAPAPDQTVVYLAATELGGYALILPPPLSSNATTEQAGADVHALALPTLTWDTVDDWLVRGIVGQPVTGGLRVALDRASVQLLEHWARDAEGEVLTERRSLPLQAVPAALPAAYSTLRRALERTVQRWREREAKVATDAPGSGRPGLQPPSRLQLPLGGALESGILRGELDWDFLEAELDVLLPELSSVILQPLHEALAALGLARLDARLALIPCGRLGALPLHAAPIHSAGAAEAIPFQETCELSYQASARGLAASRRAATDCTPDGPFVAVGNPQPTRAVSLPWAAVEAHTFVKLARQAGRKRSRALVGVEATRSQLLHALQTLARRNAGAWVDVASHGRADPADPRRCTMLLAGDETLSLADLQRERLLQGVRCFVASGCVTGLGDLDIAPDELSSFASGALQAGAAGTVATLWAVSDKASFYLLARFAKLVLQDGSSRPARALCDAACWLRTATAAEIAEVNRDASLELHAVGGGRDGASSRGADGNDALRGLPATYADSTNHTAIEAGAVLEVGVRGQVCESAGTAVTPPAATPFAHPSYWAAFVAFGA